MFIKTIKNILFSRTEFNLDKMAEKIISISDEKVPKPVQLKLPQLKKIELPKINA